MSKINILLRNIFKRNTSTHNAVIPVIQTVKEELFAGVPLSELNDLAKQIYHGIDCSVDKWGFLIFNYKSNRGNITNHVQMGLNEAGKLISHGCHYPGQIWSSADEFAKRANELFKFKK